MNELVYIITTASIAQQNILANPDFQTWVIVIVNRNLLQSVTVFWVIIFDWTDQKWNVIVTDYIANLIVIDDYLHD